jgi:hypothetical protein
MNLCTSIECSIELEDTKWGRLRFQIWHQLHLRQAANHPVLLIQVQRLKAPGHPAAQPL